MRTIFLKYNRSVLAKLALVPLICLSFALSGCGGKEVEIAWHGPVADLGEFSQDLNAYVKAETAGARLASEASQEAAASRYVTQFYKPWTLKKSEFSKKSMASRAKSFSGKSSWTASGEKIDSGLWERVIENANVKAFPSLGWKGILIENAPLRALPTSTPFYNNPNKAGEGYPFDYLQDALLWVGMPVYVSHISRDEEWLFCETAMVSGWVPSRAVSPASEVFIAFWRNQPLGAVVKDKLPTEAGRGNVGFANAKDLRVGTLLPLQNGNLLLPVAQGIATGSQPVAVPPGAVERFPLPLTAANVAKLGNEMMGEPYGWGGVDYLRDCSSMMRDLFGPFGLWLPRNSSRQIQAGMVTDLSGLAPADRERMLKDMGQPFVTLVGMPGHIMLYVGQYDGRAAVFHDIWGTRTILSEGGQGRLVIGKVVVSSLEPGVEHREVDKTGTLLNRVNKMTVIPRPE